MRNNNGFESPKNPPKIEEEKKDENNKSKKMWKIMILVRLKEE